MSAPAASTPTASRGEPPVILRASSLFIAYRIGMQSVTAVRDASFALRQGRSLGIVGESGCGKSTLARAIFGTLAANGEITSGTVAYEDEDITAPSAGLERRRWKDIALVPQAAIASLDPLYKADRQVAEIFIHHRGQSRADALARAHEIMLALDLPEDSLDKYPHELSGGMRQRVVIAAALALQPSVLIADEPTTALDTLVQKQVFERFDVIRREIGTSLILITHDLGLVADYCDDVLVMHDGVVVEQGPAKKVLAAPAHDYTRHLLAATVQLDPRDKQRARDSGGAQARPAQDPDAPLIEMRNVTRTFAPRGWGSWARAPITALDDVSFKVRRGQVLGIIGASGSGKSTLANIAIGLDRPSRGEVLFQGGAAPAGAGSQAQMVFQDPYQSMNPLYRVEWVVCEPLRTTRGHDRAQLRARAIAALEAAGLRPAEDFLRSRLHHLSGGQRQRVAIARAMIMEPDLIVADEPVSMLDVSVRAGVLETLRQIVAQKNRGMIYITHDLSTVRFVCDDLLVLRDGRVVEQGPCAQVLDAPQSDYTRALLDSIPGQDMRIGA